MAAGISRRKFLVGAAAGATIVAIAYWRLRPVERGAPAAAPTPTTQAPPAYGDWRDVYRERWAWDRIVKSTHFVNCWYQSHCAWNVYVKDGVVWREEQVAAYPQVRDDVPDFNPRGCQKGACFSERMYDPARLRYPMKRAGERGSGKWQRISWEEALTGIADSVLDTITKEGSDRVVWDLGPLYTMGTFGAAHQRFSFLLDCTSLDMNTEIGDGHRGVGETFGKIVFERSADDYFFSDLILIWGGNPIATQIPNAHFLLEARYKGAQIVTIAPDLSPSSIHADLWVPVKPGCDAALGLSMANVILGEKLYDAAFLREQTDLPLLVREDTRRYLRSSDLREGGSEEELYLHDPKRGIVPVPKKELRLGDLEPSLEGRFEVGLADGRKVAVRPVFELLRERVAAYAPEQATAQCGTPPEMIRSLARRIAKAKSACTVTTSNFGKYYHGNLTERAMALVLALGGQYGKKGSGFVGFPFLVQDGLEKTTFQSFDLPDRLKILASMLPKRLELQLEGYTEEMLVYERSRNMYQSGMATSGALFWYVHGGLLKASEKLEEWDPYLKRPVKDVLAESFEKGWQHVWPKPGNDPRVLFVYGSNPLRRIRCYPLLLENLWPKLNTIVTLDWRMTSTGQFSDYVLPVSAWYERTEHKWVTPLMPFIHAGEKATTYYEAKSDWEIISLLAQAVHRRAGERGITGFTDRFGKSRQFGDLYDRFSQHGEFGPTDDEKVARTLLENASNLEGVSWDELKKTGFARFTSVGSSIVSIGNATTIEPNDTITPLTKHVIEKEPYPTLSRRMQFYLDQDLYLEMDEALPIHKDPPIAGGNYPLMLTGGHTRWSIHSAWRDDALMLQQQRGVPVMYMSIEDAGARGITDGETVKVFNDLASFQVMAKTTPAVRPGQLILYHAWENFQFAGGKGFQNLIPSPLNPVELAGGQFHLRPMSICMQPSHTDRDTRVEVARA
ncbi:MAG: molybdopterin-dependent oxidoreductase [Deltaproteobacteria bacterium]|nr:molybdopterin-dependent oxidoreductase [Deltaproteobacteria bacterium]